MAAQLTDILAGGGDVQNCEQIGRLTGGSEHGPHAALQRRDFFFDKRQGRVGNAAVHMTVRLQIKQLAQGIGGIVFVSGALINGHHPGLTVFGPIARLHAHCFRRIMFHSVASFCCFQIFSMGNPLISRICRPSVCPESPGKSPPAAVPAKAVPPARSSPGTPEKSPPGGRKP